MTRSNEFAVIGKTTSKIDAIAKVTGDARFATDIYLKNMLWARVMRSTVAHARIVSINTEKAKKLKGVKAVLTAADMPDGKYGALVLDMAVFAQDKVRYIGEAIAAVAAIDEKTAAAAVDLIEIEYEELPAVFDPLEAMQPEAPVIHDDLAAYTTLFERTEHAMTGNVNYQSNINSGDIEAGFAEADFIFEDTYEVQKQHPSYMEPNSTVADVDETGRLIIYNTTQRPHINQAILSSLLGIPISKIRVMPCHVGGGFGGKNRTLTEPTAAALALKTRQPVRLTFSHEEEFTSATTRHSGVLKMKTGVKKDGTLIASDVKLYYDCGAYAPTPNAVWLGAISSSGAYKIPNSRVEAFSIYTNKMMGGAFRGYGAPQANFARESQMDRIARELNIDPIELRLKNCLVAGDSLHTGQKLHSARVKETLEKARDMVAWQAPKLAPNRALGVACGIFACGGFATSSIVKLNMDGTASVATGAMDMGQGLKTVMGQITAEELGLTSDDINVVTGDTDLTPFDVGIFGDRGTHTTGLAVKKAAEDAKNQLLKAAADALEVEVTALEIRDKKVFDKSSDNRFLHFREILGGGQYKKGGPIIGKSSINLTETPFDTDIVQGAASKMFSTYTFATHIVETEVNPKTGEVKVIKATAVHDCGTVINPAGLKGQIIGGLTTGLGYALFEDVIIEDGQVKNPSFLECRMPTSVDIPEVEFATVDEFDSRGPFGAKGVGNVSVINMAPAIANAVDSALGVRIKSLPITPGKILQGLEERVN
ncbi:MAG: xanthine dehydrogenase family protein molybdopterin-binding subunit [Rhodospirillaceae bacterium]|nr:xanthine dehydrogenase family protein molybdopterin-binding subunit [Rhodospirillaceae bacterium]